MFRERKVKEPGTAPSTGSHVLGESQRGTGGRRQVCVCVCVESMPGDMKDASFLLRCSSWNLNRGEKMKPCESAGSWQVDPPSGTPSSKQK